MNRLSLLIALVTLALGTLVPTAAHGQADGDQREVIARVDRPTAIAAHAGRVVWSVRTGDEFRLMTWANGTVTDVPVPSRPVPFDVDLGPGPDGDPVAVYSRCRTEGAAGGFNIASYLAGRGCDIYMYDFEAGRERRVAEVSSPGGSEAWPTIWRSKLAFARAYDNKRNYPYIYVKDLSSDRGSRRLPGGPRNKCRRSDSGRRECTNPRLSQPIALELYGRRLAFAWRYADFTDGFAYDLRLDDLGLRNGNPRRLVHQRGGGLTAIVVGWPGFEQGDIYWSAACFGDPGGCPGRRLLARSSYAGPFSPSTVDPREAVFSHDRASRSTYLLIDTFGSAGGTECRGDPDVPGGTCLLVRTQPRYGAGG